MRALLPTIALAACALLSGPLRADGASSLRTLDLCLAKLAPGAAPAPAGIDELRLLCPDLEQAINDSGLSPQLPEHWQRWLDRNSIEDIRRLLQRYQAPLPSAAPAVATLYQVAHTLNPSEPPHGWWQDLKAWLRKWLQPPESSDRSWLSRGLSQLSLPPPLLQSLFYVLVGVILIVTLWIVRREFKIASAGVRAGAGAVSRSAPLPADAQPLSLDEVDRAPPREQPALLLRLLVQALLQSGRLVNDRPLTHRELAARSGIDDIEQRERFERISLLAERLLYGPVVTLTASSNGTASAAMRAHGAQSLVRQALVRQALADGRDLYTRWMGRGAPAA